MARIGAPHFAKQIAMLGASLAIGAACLTAQANAVTLTWYLNNATFDDGGIATGSFMFDADTNVFSNISVTTSGGNIAGNTYNFAGLGAREDFAAFGTTSGSLVGASYLRGILEVAMTNAGGTIPIVLGSLLTGETAICPNNVECLLVIADRFWASGSLTTVNPNPVPLPGALPLFATGLGALGLLGWRRKRKQAAA